MKHRDLARIVMACSLGACGGTVQLNTADAGSEDGGGGVTTDSAIDAVSCGPSSEGPSISPSISVPRFAADGMTPYPLRPENEQPGGIDSKDCTDDIWLQFSLTVCDLPTTDTLEAWAGTTDCTQPSARGVGGTGPRCWLVCPSGAGQGTREQKVLIRAEDIVGYLGNSSPPLSYTEQPASSCQVLDSLLDCGAPMGVYFLAINSDGITVDGISGLYTFSAFGTPPDSASCSAADSGTGFLSPACGLAFYPPDYPPLCQTNLDDACCSQETACADNAACFDLIDCANACPTPRQDSCVNACANGDAGVAAEFTALQSCSSAATPAVGVPAGACDWPN